MGEPITIVGAGPAGLTAAIILAHHGLKVRVIERAAEVGHRLAGDFQGFENWSSERDVLQCLREIGIDINFLCIPYGGGTVYASGMAPVGISSERPIFYLVKRGPLPGSLDLGLKEQAEAAGAEIHFNRRLEGERCAHIVGTGPRGVDALATGVTFTTDLSDRAVVVFDNEIAPRGYVYLLIHRGEGTMATVLYRDFHREAESFPRMLRFLREREGVEPRDARKFTSYGNFFIRDSQVAGETRYVGEAAGFQDGLWSFGMRYAILSGYLAARSIIDGTDYDLLWKRELKPLLETSLVNRLLLERFGHVGYRHITRQLAKGEPCTYLRRHYNPSLLKQLLFPLALQRETHGRERAKT